METDDIGDINNIPITGVLAEDDSSQLNISDVIEVIQTTDPTTAIAMFNQNSVGNGGNGAGDGGGGGGGGGLQQQQQQQSVTVNGPTNGPMQGSSPQHQDSSSLNRNIRRKAYVRIVEQPASKALRFRYECEGRSAGSIPGINSTPECKTFPTIEIVGYKGRAVIVVSCVTKDPPYRPHPHNLVGKEGCKKGVCTLEINSETMRAVFSNLGIQCVKKKDIENALRAREEIRVDPFKTGFQHRFQPSSIDLNCVRLCFQVFLANEKGRFTCPLPPVVSDPIYDKKAMSDLVICTLCSCSSTVAGGKEIILLCEKVAKEDISVRFFEEHDGQLIWEGYGDFQHTDVHKQTAIKFKTPRYKTLEIDQPIKVNIQLRRPSDGATSEALPFDYLPLDSGRRSFWSIHKDGLRNKPDLDIFQKILADVNELTKSPDIDDAQSKEIINLDTPQNDEQKSLLIDEESKKSDLQGETKTEDSEIDTIVKECVKDMEIEQEVPQLDSNNVSIIDKQEQNDIPTANEKISEWIKTSEFERKDSVIADNSSKLSSVGGPSMSDDDKTLYDLLEQVAELDEIYTDHQIRRETFQNTIANEMSGFNANGLSKKNSTTTEQMDFDEFFDDAATYTSLQKAFKNPIQMTDILPPTPPASQLAPEDTNYDPVDILVNPPAPVIDVNTLKRESVAREEEKLPPLPPKRVKKHENIENRPLSASQTTLDRNKKSNNNSGNSSPRPQSQIIIMKTPDQSPPTKKLPPTPEHKNKKSGFFSKLFSRRKSKSDISEGTGSSPQSKKGTPSQSREPSIANFSPHDPNRLSTKSVRSLQPSSPGGRVKTSKPVGRSVSSVSGKRPHLTADIIHIPLKGERGDSSTNSLPMNEAYSNASTITLNNNLDRKTVSALQLADLPLQEGNMELVAIADAQSLRNLCEGEFGVQLDPSVDLTEAEHFALYTSIAPQATVSEFDETSCYYAPVDAGEILTPAEVAKRLTALNQS